MKIGDKVKIKNFGRIYTTYTEMFIKMGFKNPIVPKEINDKKEFEDVEFIVFAKEKHKYEKRKVFGIEDENGNQFLFSKRGIKKIEIIDLDKELLK